MRPNWRSSGVATDEAIISGLAPGMLACTAIVGKSTSDNSATGTAANPMTSDEIRTKARSLMAPVIGQPSTSKLIDRVFALENVKDIRELRPLLQK